MLSIKHFEEGKSLTAEDNKSFHLALDVLDESIRELRRVAHNMMPESLSRYGLKTALFDFCASTPTVSFSWYGDDARFNSKLEVMVYRVIHELVNNALKHSHANQIDVQVILEPDRISFTVEDNGVGFDPATAGGGAGLGNIRTRVQAFGGIMSMMSTPGNGAEIHVEVGLTAHG